METATLYLVLFSVTLPEDGEILKALIYPYIFTSGIMSGTDIVQQVLVK